MNPITDPSILEGYLIDASNLHGHADGLFRPHTTAEVAEVLRAANAQQIQVTITAGQTSTTAGAVPYGGWVLSTENLTEILEISSDTATAQGGILLGEFQAAIEATGRFYPPDPTSSQDCALGASVATNASGARSFKYGPTRPWIEALEVVLPSGEVLEIDANTPIPPDWPVPVWTEPKVKTAAGYYPATRLLDLFIGSEGTLGVITKVTVRLTQLPAEVLGLIAFFPNRQSATRFMRTARAAQRADAEGPLSPRCIEYLDHYCLALAGSRVGDVPVEARAALFCEQEVSVDEEIHLSAWLQTLEECGALVDDTLLTTDEAGRRGLLSFRHAIPAGINEIVVKNGVPKVGTDLSVPDDALDEMMDLYEACPLPHALFGHFGDNHLHLNLLPASAEEVVQAKQFYSELAARAVALGGSVSAEHGIGKTKREYLITMVGESVISQFSKLKSYLDPQWILGRGNLISPKL